MFEAIKYRFAAVIQNEATCHAFVGGSAVVQCSMRGMSSTIDTDIMYDQNFQKPYFRFFSRLLLSAFIEKYFKFLVRDVNVERQAVYIFTTILD